MAPSGVDRRLVADVGQVGAGQAGGLTGQQREVDRGIHRLVARVHAQDLGPADDIRGRDEDLAVKAAGAQQRRVELVQQVGRGDHDDVAAGVEAIHLDEQLVERLVMLLRVCPAGAADGIELVDEHDRRGGFARGAEQPADAGRADADEHLHERGRRLGEERGPRLVGGGLGEHRLAGAGRSVEQDPLGHLGAHLLEAARIAQEVDDLAQLLLGLVGAGDLRPADGRDRLGADLLGPRAGHHPRQRDDGEHEDAHEDQRQPVVHPREDVGISEERAERQHVVRR